MSDRVPSYRKKKTKAGIYAVVTLPDGMGRRRDVMLGAYGSAESRAEYRRVIAEWVAAGKQRSSAADITIAELIGRFWPWVEQHYRHQDGTPTTEPGEYKMSLRPLNYLYGDQPAKTFGPLALEAVRKLLVDGYKHPKHGEQPALARTVVNKRVNRIRKLFRWGVQKEIIPVEVHQRLATVEGLERGRSDAKEPEPVLPVSRAVVEATLPILTPMVADMVRLQLETGMRSGELVIMRPIDIDTTGAVWLYRPTDHKAQHLDHERVIAIGPKGQAVIKRWFTTNTHAFIFSAKRSREEQNAQRRKDRKTPLWPSHIEHQQRKRKRSPKRAPKDRYTATSFGRAIAQAIERHNDGKAEADKLVRWHPHQLRHLRALEVKRAGGLDVARAVLGHRCPAITEHYATLDVATAAELMAKIG
jgi:integrase